MCLFHLVAMVLGSEDASTGETAGQEQRLNIEGAKVPPIMAAPMVHRVEANRARRHCYYAVFDEITPHVHFREIHVVTHRFRVQIYFNQSELYLRYLFLINQFILITVMMP